MELLQSAYQPDNTRATMRSKVLSPISLQPSGMPHGNAVAWQPYKGWTFVASMNDEDSSCLLTWRIWLGMSDVAHDECSPESVGSVRPSFLPGDQACAVLMWQ
eukprot:2240856-Amphidinium_carterae.1